MATNPITHAELADALARSHLGIGASDLHGSLAGYLCGGGSADAEHWLDALELAPHASATGAPAAQPMESALLKQLYRDCDDWLADPDLGFEPLLPGGEVALEARAAAVVEWCRGFLGGLGLAGAGHGNALSAEAEEILSDFATIAASNFEYADTEEDESALTEVVEFIRVGTLLLHAELHASPQSGATVH